MLKVGSLFSGAGLCDLGLTWAGLRHMWFCETDRHCRSVLARHWPHVPIYEDVRQLESRKIPPVDVICGGFPCQDVSNGGKRAGIREGTRSGLWKEFARCIGESRPRYAIIENVRGLLSCGMEIVLHDLAEIGYDAEWEVLPAAALGAPHHRERVFIVAYPHGRFPNGGHRLLSPLKRNMGDVHEPPQLFDWLGLRIDRASRTSSLEVFPGPVLYRVDDGRAGRMDGGVRSHSHALARADMTAARDWISRLKALGNGITPQQSYAIAACILEAEGLPVPPCPERATC